MKQDLDHQILTTGVERVGELGVWSMRKAVSDQDHHNAWVAGANYAFNQVNLLIESKLSVSGPYDDNRALQDMQIWLGDMIRSIHDNPDGGNRNA